MYFAQKLSLFLMFLRSKNSIILAPSKLILTDIIPSFSALLTARIL